MNEFSWLALIPFERPHTYSLFGVFLMEFWLSSYDDFSLPHMYMCNVMRTARHATVNNANTYQKDANTLFEVAHRERHNSDNKIGVFKSIVLEIGTHGFAITASTRHQKAFPELARWWYSSCLGLKDRPVGDRPVEILILACNHRQQLHGIDEIKSRLTRSIRNSNEVSEIMDMISSVMPERSREETARIHHQLEEARAQSTQPSQQAFIPVAPTRKENIRAQ